MISSIKILYFLFFKSNLCCDKPCLYDCSVIDLGRQFIKLSLKIDFDAAVTGISTTVSTNDVLIWQIIGDGESASWSGISEGPSGGWSEVSNGSSVSWSEVSAGPSGGWTEVSDASTIWTEIDP